MRRLLAGLVFLAAAVLVAACGSADVVGPAVTANWSPEIKLTDSTVYSVALSPTDDPGGVIALKVVRGGEAKTISAYRFRALQGPGSATVAVGRHIAASWTLPGSGTWLQHSREQRLRGAKPFATAWSGATLGPGELEGEHVLWAQERYLGASPTCGSLPMGEFVALLNYSDQHPRRTMYCLTLELEAP